MEFVWDMGDHAVFVWPSYAAFLAVFAGLAIWAWRGSAKTRESLARLEKELKR
ncbi:MAG: heme exporter protein CcmD [Pseudomonadota bacterium]